MFEEVPQHRPDLPCDEALGLGGEGGADVFNDLRRHVIHNTLFLGSRSTENEGKIKGYNLVQKHTCRFLITAANEGLIPGGHYLPMDVLGVLESIIILSGYCETTTNNLARYNYILIRRLK